MIKTNLFKYSIHLSILHKTISSPLLPNNLLHLLPIFKLISFVYLLHFYQTPLAKIPLPSQIYLCLYLQHIDVLTTELYLAVSRPKDPTIKLIILQFTLNNNHRHLRLIIDRLFLPNLLIQVLGQNLLPLLTILKYLLYLQSLPFYSQAFL